MERISMRLTHLLISKNYVEKSMACVVDFLIL